ncbi:MAG: hypothetical protein VX964_04645 [Verrucomicrobiota bacterium]|nr:hypothetical protein [Verrucomicrobiota bacterium]
MEVPKLDTPRKTIKKARPDAWNSTEAMEVDGYGYGYGDGDTILKWARDDVGEPVVSEDAKRQKVEEDRKNAVTVADAIKHVKFGSGVWNVSEKIIFFASCMHVRPWLSASISWKALSAAMKEMAAYFRLTFKAEYKCRNERVCKDFIKSVKDKKVKVPMPEEQWWIDHLKKCKDDSPLPEDQIISLLETKWFNKIRKKLKKDINWI